MNGRDTIYCVPTSSPNRFLNVTRDADVGQRKADCPSSMFRTIHLGGTTGIPSRPIADGRFCFGGMND